MAMSRVLINLMNGADWLDLAELELRLRELNANARLVAIPINEAPDGMTARFAGRARPFQGAVRVPPFYLWVGVNGPEEAERRIKAGKGASDRENLERLKLTGVLATMESVHSKFEPKPDPSNVPQNEEAKRLYAVLTEYVRRGQMNQEAGHLVAQVVNQYLEKYGSSKRFSVNRLPDAALINIYVLASDPEGHFRRIDCNCGYIPGTSAIICDDKFLRQFREMIKIDAHEADEDAADVLEVINLRFSFFLLQWIVGHELGHLVLDHNFDAAYFDVQPMLNADNRIPPKVRRDFETAADRFAIENLSDQQDIFYSWLGLSNVVSRNYGDAIQKQYERDGIRFVPNDIKPLAAKDRVVLLDSKAAHPPFLIRAAQLANVVLQLHKEEVVDTTGHFDRVLSNLSLGTDGVASRTMCKPEGR